MFFYEVEGHMPKLSSFGRGKKIWPKKSLTRLLHEALQLFLFLHVSFVSQFFFFFFLFDSRIETQIVGSIVSSPQSLVQSRDSLSRLYKLCKMEISRI